MNCLEQEDRIQAYLDDELGPVERTDFEAHLAGCLACQQQVAREQALVALLDGLEPVPEPVNFTSNVLAGLPRPLVPPLVRWALAAQAALTVALLALIYPRLAGWYTQLGAWFAPGWLANLFAGAAIWLGDTWAWLASTLTIDLHLAWPTGFGLAWPQAALLAAILAGLWALGNRLLLAPEQKQTGGIV
jgi:anti-sigma factor RsiW